MIRPACVPRPIAGKTSPIWIMSRKIAMMASSCGNICRTRSVSQAEAAAP